ncbi:MAG: Ldh family oxidoreductase [Peptococcaceae bacterium]|nr:Ldh family oxidoreductase [Peptococcaceae bacterium]
MSAIQSYTPQQAKAFALDILKAIHVPDAEAEIIAESLLQADLRGVKSHGLIRLPAYIRRIEAKVMNPVKNIQVIQDSGSTALIDANNTFGPLAGHAAMTKAIEKAKEFGAGMVAVRNSNHFGVSAYYTMMAADQDMIGIVMTNAAPALAPFGAKTALMGTNPVSVTIPADEEPALVLDMSSTLVARGKIRYAATTHQDIPLGWALDPEGKPTADPEAALKGTLEPIGGPKGSGLALMIEILCSLLTGTGFLGEVRETTDLNGPMKTGHLFCAFEIARFTDPKAFKKEIDRCVRLIKSLPSISGGPIYLPGEIEYLNVLKNQKDGLAYDGEVVASLNQLAASLGVKALPVKEA